MLLLLLLQCCAGLPRCGRRTLRHAQCIVEQNSGPAPELKHPQKRKALKGLRSLSSVLPLPKRHASSASGVKAFKTSGLPLGLGIWGGVLVVEV